MRGLEQIRDTLAKITQGDDLLDMLYEFERTLDSVGLDAYKNWYSGELIEGPKISKYWIECTFMFPQSKMPDPRGAMRLRKIGCNVYFEEDILKQPVKITSPSSWDNALTKKAKLRKVPVWIVRIEMPMKYITDNYDEINSFLADSEEVGDKTSILDANTNAFNDDMGGDLDFGEEEDLIQ